MRVPSCPLLYYYSKFSVKNSTTVVYYTYTYRGCAIGAAKLQHRSRAPGAFFCGDHGRHRKALKNATTGGKCVKTSGFSARLFTKGAGRKNRVFLKKISWKYRSGPIAGRVPSSEKWSSHHRPLLGPISLFPYEACVCSRLFFHREKTRYMRGIIGPPPFSLSEMGVKTEV